MSSEKTEPASDYKIRKLREEGQIAFSSELSILATALAFTTSMVFVWNIFWPNLVDFWQSLLKEAPEAAKYDEKLLHKGINLFVVFLGIPLASAASASVATTLFMTQFLFSLKRLHINFNRLNIFENIKSLISLKSLLELFRQTIIMILVSYFTIKSEFFVGGIIDLWRFCGSYNNAVVDCLGIALLWILMPLVKNSLIIVMAAAIFDYITKKYFFLQSHKMTKAEVKAEHKNLEGNEFVKSRRRSLHRELLREELRSLTSNASVLIVNPTHIAVAMLYDPEKGVGVPFIIYIAEGFDALIMKEAAEDFNIFIFESPELARTILRDCESGKYIPESLYGSVAIMLSYVYSVTRNQTGNKNA